MEVHVIVFSIFSGFLTDIAISALVVWIAWKAALAASIIFVSFAKGRFEKANIVKGIDIIHIIGVILGIIEGLTVFSWIWNGCIEPLIEIIFFM